MKLVSRIGLIIMLLFAFVPMNSLNAAPGDGAPSPYYDNLMVNGTFDTGVTGWDVWSPQDIFEVVYLPSDLHNSVLKIQTENIPAQWGTTDAHQRVEMGEYQPYSLSADIFFETSLDSMVTMRIDFYNQSGVFIAYEYKDIYYPNNAFETVTINGLAPKGTSYSKVEFDLKAFEAGAKGTVYVDNVKLQYQWAPTNLRVSDKTDTSIKLAWDAPRYGAGYQYEVYDSTDKLIGKSVLDTVYSINELVPNKAYSYYVVAVMDTKESLKSNLLQTATNKPDNWITIMPLGDSITKGVYPGGDIPGGYRGYLWELMHSKYPNAHFVGSLNNNPANIVNFDPDHEGHSGITTTRIANEVMDSQVFVYAPDIILFHAGSNDMWDAHNHAADNMEQMLTDITERLPNTYVIVASIPGIYENNDPEDAGLLPRIRDYNIALKEIVQQLRVSGKKVGFVDMNAMVTEPYFTAPGGDLIHPNAEGYKTMADVWYDALDAVIAKGDLSKMVPGAPILNYQVLNPGNTVQLSWQPVIDNVGVDRYEIYQNDSKIDSVTNTTYYSVTGLAPSTAYNFSVDAIDKAGNRSHSNTVTAVTYSVPTPSTAPTAPTGLTVVNVTYDSIQLSWLPGTDDHGIKGYEVSYNGLPTTVSNAVYGSYEITGLTPETQYSIVIKSIGSTDLKSEGSVPLTVETKAAPITGLEVTQKSSTSITLAWNPAIDKDGITEYRIKMNDLPPVTTKETTYTFNNLVPNQMYSFKVSAVDQLNNETTPTTLSQLMELQPPTGLAMTEKSTNMIKVRWSSVEGAIGYKVFVNGVLKTTVTNNEYRIEQLTHNTSYSISVKALFGKGLESASSSAIVIKTDIIPDRPVYGGVPYIPASSAPLQEFTKTDQGIKLRFVPDMDESKKILNGAEDRLVVSIPSGKPFDRLELELSGEVLKLAADKKKPIEIQMGGLKLELPPSWIKAEGKDNVKLIIAVRSLEKDESALKQSLKPLSSAFNFEVQLNNSIVSTFSKPVKLNVATNGTPSQDLSGVYLMDESTGTWTFQGGSIGSSGQVMLELAHFSEYAVFTGMKTFADISSHWARKDIESLAAKQIVFGLTNDQFGPSGEVKRSEFAVMLARAFKVKAVDGKLPFDDVAEQAWYHDGIKAAYQAGWIQGVSEAHFDPNARITREQMAVMIMKAYKYAKKNSLTQEELTKELPPFKDVSNISDWAISFVREAYAKEIINGMDGSFKPSQYADRAQAAAMINRLLKLRVQ